MKLVTLWETAALWQMCTCMPSSGDKKSRIKLYTYMFRWVLLRRHSFFMWTILIKYGVKEVHNGKTYNPMAV